MTKREKMLILPTRLSIQIHIQYVPLKYPRIFQTDLGSLDPSERVTSRKARGPQVAGENKLQVVDLFFLLYTKLKEGSFNSVLRTPGCARAN